MDHVGYYHWNIERLDLFLVCGFFYNIYHQRQSRQDDTLSLVMSDSQSLTLTTGAPYSCTNGRGFKQYEYSLWRHRFTDNSVEVTLRSDCLGCLSWPGRRGVLYSKNICVISRSLPVAGKCIDGDDRTGENRPIKFRVESWLRPLQMLIIWELRISFTAEETETAWDTPMNWLNIFCTNRDHKTFMLHTISTFKC